MISVSLAVLSSNASAYVLQFAKVVNSYGKCTWQNNGDGTSTIDLTINFRSITGNLGKNTNGSLRPDSEFNSRGVLIYTYDANGKLLPSSAAAKSISMNGRKASGSFKDTTYVIYYLSTAGGKVPEWHNRDAYTAELQVVIDNSQIRNWPGIAIRAGAFTTGDDVGEVTGAAYVSNMGSTSACRVLDPTVPPPPPPPAIEINMAAPDWDLGELPRGDDERTLSGATQQLCFTYSGVDSYRNFVIDATSKNGVLGGRYLLANSSKPSETVSYDLTLDSGSASFLLPNTAGSMVKLDKGNRTCFVPTFRTSVGIGAGAGDYSDVLSFTVITKS